MITRQQALTVNQFHEDHEPAGKICQWRRNGTTQTWKTRPDEFRIPVKYGLRSYDQITQDNASQFHAEADCPTRYVRVNLANGVTFNGIVITHHVNPDGALNGITRVQVTTRGKSRHRVSSQVDVGTRTLTYL